MPKFRQDNILKALDQLLPGGKANHGNVMSLGATSSGGSGFMNVFSRSCLLGKGETDKYFGDSMVSSGRDVLNEVLLPVERLQRYTFLEEMAAYPTIGQALYIHISYAFSINKRTNLSFEFQPVADENDEENKAAHELCRELTNDIGLKVNAELPSWGLIMAIFGVCYIRPHIAQKVGITSMECNYYTLPYFIKEYYVGGDLAGFTGDYLKDETGALMFAKPWDMVSMKIPLWHPSRQNMPIYTGAEQFSLLSDPTKRMPVETQNYGTSLLQNAYEPYLNLRGAIRALKASRYNASKIDRLIGLNMDNLDPAKASLYGRTVSEQLQKSAMQMEKRARGNNTAPVVTNTVLPILANGKGQITIDTQSMPADISGIEDIMFHIKQLASALNLDYTMLGFADQMTGGLGEGGFLRTSIQAGMVAGWLRGGAAECIYRLCDIHLAAKCGKVYPSGERPYKIEFNSMATSIEMEESAAMDSHANYASVFVTIADAICNNPALAKSNTFKQIVLGDVLKIPATKLETLLTELKASQDEDHENDFGGGNKKGMFESVTHRPDAAMCDFIRSMDRHELQDIIIKAFEE